MESIRFFTSYAHDDSQDAERFHKVLTPLLKSSTKYEFDPWHDQQLLPGEHWRSEIEQALDRSRFGILLLSPAFLASDFVNKHELPQLLAKPVLVPVELQRILFDGTLDLKGLEHRQVFRDSKGRSFDRCRTPADRRDFALELFQKIVALLEKNPC